MEAGMLFWNDVSSSPFQRIYRSSGKTASDAIVQFDDKWDDFFDIAPNDKVLASMTDEQMCRRFGMTETFFDDHLASALRLWRISPSRSMISLIGGIDGNSIPSGNMFGSIEQQTKVLAAAVLSEALHMSEVRSVVGPEVRKPLMVASDFMAAALTDEGVETINNVARYLKAWEMRNLAKVTTGLVKPPKVLYRGIRNRNIEAERLQEVKDEKWNIRHCRFHDMRRDVLESKPLVEVSGNPILSFTAKEDVAKLFTEGEGFVVEIDPSQYSVVAGWATEDGLAGKDDVINRHEREWIIRPSANFVPSPEQVKSRDRTLAFSTNDQSGIEMLHHYDEAEYVLDKRKVKAWFKYNPNGKGGRIVFQLDGEGWGEGALTIKKKFGFDPVPGPDRKAKKLHFTHKRMRFGDSEGYAPYIREASGYEETRSQASGRSPR
jgi:hypothetical protein